MWVPLLFVLLDECFGVCIDGKDCLIRFVCDSVACGCEVSVLEKFSQLHSGVAFGLNMFVPHPGNDLLCSQEELFWECSSLSVDGKVELSFLVMDLCVAMRDALSTSSWSPSMGPILLSPNVISAVNLSHHPASSTVSGLNSTKAMSDIKPMCVRYPTIA